jgi:glutamine synthetase
VSGNIFAEENKAFLDKLDSLPASCWESAESLARQRKYFEEDNVFPKGLIDAVVKRLKSYDDRDLSERLYGKKEELAELVNRYLHCS